MEAPTAEPSETPPARRGSWAIWVSVCSVLLCAVCIYYVFHAREMALEAERRLTKAIAGLEETREEMVEIRKGVEERLSVAERDRSEVSFSIQKNEDRIRNLTTDLANTREVLGAVVNRLREQTEAIMSLAERAPAGPGTPSGGNEQVTEETEAPDPEPAPEPDPEPESGRPAPAVRVTVQPGDTLSAIARRLNVSVPELLDANPDINPNLIQPGQVLRVPGQ